MEDMIVEVEIEFSSHGVLEPTESQNRAIIQAIYNFYNNAAGVLGGKISGDFENYYRQCEEEFLSPNGVRRQTLFSNNASIIAAYCSPNEHQLSIVNAFYDAIIMKNFRLLAANTADFEFRTESLKKIVNALGPKYRLSLAPAIQKTYGVTSPELSLGKAAALGDMRDVCCLIYILNIDINEFVENRKTALDFACEEIKKDEYIQETARDLEIKRDKQEVKAFLLKHGAKTGQQLAQELQQLAQQLKEKKKEEKILTSSFQEKLTLTPSPSPISNLPQKKDNPPQTNQTTSEKFGGTSNHNPGFSFTPTPLPPPTTKSPSEESTEEFSEESINEEPKGGVKRPRPPSPNRH